ncbi:MAG TPA: hypothetical protein VMV84_01890 [Dehalococcoidales bacterium]|nr:hypothetical protein [Dehalococcoidales bacterium]
MNDVLVIILIVVIVIVAMLGIPYLMMKRAVGRVINIFRNNSAIDARSAKTIDELGLRPRTRMQGMFRGRDYKPQALNFLIKAEIVRMNEDGKLYLSDDKLAASKLYKR